MQERPTCAICRRSDALVGVIVGGKQFYLCREHARKLDGVQPQNYAELTHLFALPEFERRETNDRRQRRRRNFPPRPEGRRLNTGRRDGDHGH